jgi:hypothetical protein
MMKFDMNGVFRKNDLIFLKEVNGEPALIDPYRRMLVTLNSAAFVIWQMVDGRSSAAAIIEQLKAEFDIDGKTLEKDVVDLFKDFIRREMILECSAR